jgi:hypothetical protein
LASFIAHALTGATKLVPFRSSFVGCLDDARNRQFVCRRHTLLRVVEKKIAAFEENFPTSDLKYANEKPSTTAARVI